MNQLRYLALILLLTFGSAGTFAQPSAPKNAKSSASVPPHRDKVVLVGFVAGLTPEQQAEIVAKVGAVDLRTIGAETHVLAVPAGHVMDRVNALKKLPGVRYAEPDWIQHVDGGQIPNDPSFPNQWALQNTGKTINGVTGISGADERAVPAWGYTTGSASIVVAITDTGLDYNHPDLAANVWSSPSSFNVTINGQTYTCPAGSHGFNVLGVVGGTTGQQCNPMDDDTAWGGHGTHVAGIIGAVGNNSTGVSGVNWVTSLLPVKWVNSSGTGATSDLITGLQGIVSLKQSGVNIRVVNDSQTWQGTASSQALSDEIDVLGANEILFVTASGNTAENNDTTPRYPCVYDRPNQLCAAASDQTDHLWSSANWGATTVQIAAPGANIYSTLRNGTYGYISGGSMAAAETSGAAALLLANSALNTTDLRAAIMNSVDVLSSLSGKVSTSGRLNICNAIPGCASPSNTALPVISGSAVQGQTLSTTNGTWANNPTGFSYQWNRCNTSGSSCAAIPTATASSYLLTASDVGFTIRSAVTATNATGSTTANSAATPVVTAIGSGSSIALIQSNSARASNASSIATSFSTSNTSGNLILALVRMSTTTQTVTVTDSQGNTYVDAVSQVQTADSSQIHLFYAKNIKAGSNTVTARFSAKNTHPAIVVLEYQGLSTTAPLDKTAHAQGSSNSPSSGATATTSTPNELVFAGLGLPYNSGATVTAGTGYKLEQGITSGSRVATEDRIVSNTGAFAGTFSLGSSTNWSALVATFVGTSTGPATLSISTTSLPGGTVGTSYSQTVSATGGTPPYTWSVSVGSLPAGLSLNASTGAFTGTPTTAGTSSFTIKVTDAASSPQAATQALGITINSVSVAPALVQATSSQGTGVSSLSQAFPSSNTAGNLIIAFVRMSSTTQTVTVSDSAGNVYTDAIAQPQDADGSQIHIFYARNIKAGANNVTATFSATNNHPYLAVYEYAGLNTSTPLDRVASAQGSSASAACGPTATTSTSPELVFSGLGLPSTSTLTVTAGSGYHLEQQDTIANGSRAASEDAIISSVAAVTATYSISGSTNWSCTVATFH